MNMATDFREDMDYYSTNTKRGILWKQGRGRSIGFIKPWRKRLFVLDMHKLLLSYYDVPKDDWNIIPPSPRTWKGSVSVEDCTVTLLLETDYGRPHAFSVEQGGNIIVISCKSDGEKNEWIKAISTATDARSIETAKGRIRFLAATNQQQTSHLLNRQRQTRTTAIRRTNSRSPTRLCGRSDVPCPKKANSTLLVADDSTTFQGHTVAHSAPLPTRSYVTHDDENTSDGYTHPSPLSQTDDCMTVPSPRQTQLQVTCSWESEQRTARGSEVSDVSAPSGAGSWYAAQSALNEEEAVDVDAIFHTAVLSAALEKISEVGCESPTALGSTDIPATNSDTLHDVLPANHRPGADGSEGDAGDGGYGGGDGTDGGSGEVRVDILATNAVCVEIAGDANEIGSCVNDDDEEVVHVSTVTVDISPLQRTLDAELAEQSRRREEGLVEVDRLRRDNEELQAIQAERTHKQNAAIAQKLSDYRRANFVRMVEDEKVKSLQAKEDESARASALAAAEEGELYARNLLKRESSAARSSEEDQFEL